MITTPSLREALATKQSINSSGLPRSLWSLAMTIFCFLNFVPEAQSSGYCDDAKNNIELNKCGNIYWKREDAALQVIYDDLISDLKQQDTEYPLNGPSRSGSREKKLREAQRAWIKYRDLSCASEGLIFGGGGTISSQLEYGCLTAITKQRALELQKILNFSWEK